ncbi:2-oxoglutarate and iron-dependent oxygenase domain-containing protein [Streptomyces cacaoi]
MHSTIPDIDLSQWRSVSATRRAVLAADLDRSLRETGVFFLSGFDMPNGLEEALKGCGRAFFELPNELKKSCVAETASDHGWKLLADDLPAPENGKLPASPLNHGHQEAFRIGRENLAGEMALDRFYYPPNRWPEGAAILRLIAIRYTACMVRVAQEVNALLAEVLGLAADFFAGHATEACWTQHVMWHPPADCPAFVERPPARRRFGADVGLFTLRSQLVELQAVSSAGEYSTWQCPDGSLIVNLGSLMERWTDGRWRAPKYRFVTPSSLLTEEETVSLAFSFEADPEAWIQPLAEPIGGGAGHEPALSRFAVLQKLGVTVPSDDDTSW